MNAWIADQLLVGIAKVDCSTGTYLGDQSGGFGMFAPTGKVKQDGNDFRDASEGCSGFGKEDVILLEFDSDQMTLTISKNGR